MSERPGCQLLRQAASSLWHLVQARQQRVQVAMLLVGTLMSRH